MSLLRANSTATTNSAVLPSSSSIQFSALPSSSASNTNLTSWPAHATYSHHHPKNNPHPASPALDNASVITLASSTADTREEQLEARMNAQDENASMRALPPSRRVSESSLNSRYSGAVLSQFGNRPASLLTVATTNTGILYGKERRASAGLSLAGAEGETAAQRVKFNAQHPAEEEMVTAPSTPAAV